MKSCTGETAQFASYEDCVQFNEQSLSSLDNSCAGTWGFGESRFCRMINQYAIKDGDVESCARVGSKGGSVWGGAACVPEECDYRKHYDHALLMKAKHAVFSFEAMGSHECIDGIWESSEYMFTMQAPVADGIKDGTGSTPFDCLIIGQDSYFKISKGSRGRFTFGFKLSTILRDIKASGELSYGMSKTASGSDAVLITLSIDGDVIADMKVPIGSFGCMNIFSIDMCSSWRDEEVIGSRRLSEKKPVKLYLKVDGKETESIVIAEESPRESAEKSEKIDTTLPMEVVYEDGSEYSLTALLHMTPIALIAVSGP
jgi:hypothetical protein